MKDEIHVWTIPLDRAAPDESVLAPAERERAARFRFEHDRRRFVAARAALRRILAGYAGCEPGAIEFQYGEHGKPSLAGATPLRFNASHSQDLAMCAVACGREVGVDVEKVRPGIDWEDIARRFFPPRETPRSPEEFFRLWTRREAYIKALGLGLSGIGEPFRSGWTVLDLDVEQGWAAALAYEGQDCRISRKLFET